MLYFYFGTDRKRTRDALNAAVGRVSGRETRVVRVSDASSAEDVRAALSGGSMFATVRIVILEDTLANDDMRNLVFSALEGISESSDHYFILEEKPLVDIRRRVEKYAKDLEKFVLPAGREARRDGSIFQLAYALRAGDKRKLWLGLQREFAKDTAAEAIHGALFWGAKDMFLSAKKETDRSRGARLLAQLAELPHESRRRGEELEYALERFVLSGP